MRLALFDHSRLGVVSPDERTLVDVSAAVPGHDADEFGASWWVRLCRDFDALRPALESAAGSGEPLAVADVRLRAPVLSPSKIVACASNSSAHVREMGGVMQRTSMTEMSWLYDFDVFLKAPSSLTGPHGPVVLGGEHIGHEVHHEAELAIIVGKTGHHIDARDAMAHVLGYSLGLDMTLRAEGDRSRRKSYDTYTPIGPWLVTRDEVVEPSALRIRLDVGGVTRQDFGVADLINGVPEIVEHASSVMTLNPGDVILAGAPPGVGPVKHGDVMEISGTGLGSMSVVVTEASA